MSYRNRLGDVNIDVRSFNKSLPTNRAISSQMLNFNAGPATKILSYSESSGEYLVGFQGRPFLGVDVDWYGNTPLHHAFARGDVNVAQIKRIMTEFPNLASQPNQFGRIPLHYALDRIKVSIAGLRVLLRHYPEGVAVADFDNNTPYDIAAKWKASGTVKRLLLELAPSLDRNTYYKLKYGPLASIAIWAHARVSANKTVGVEYHASRHKNLIQENDMCINKDAYDYGVESLTDGNNCPGEDMSQSMNILDKMGTSERG